MIIGIIPQWGRTSRHVLQRLGELSGRNLEIIAQILEDGKSSVTTDQIAAQNNLRKIQEQGHTCFSLRPYRTKEDHPLRIALRDITLQIGGISFKLEGDEPHAGSTLIRNDESDFAVTGYDELLIHNMPMLKGGGRWARTWGNHNHELEASTDVMVAGSAGIMYDSKGKDRPYQDFAGMFLIGNPKKRPVTRVPDVFNGSVEIFVKGRYEGIVLYKYPQAKTLAVENVEEAVRDTPNSYGVELVQSGASARKNDLIVYGSPLILTETLLVVNYGRWKKNQELQQLVQALKPQGYFDEARARNFVDWYILLEENLRENWFAKPEVEEMFLCYEEISRGLRPYNLRSNGWRASDSLPDPVRSEQLQFVHARKRQVADLYFQSFGMGTIHEACAKIADFTEQNPVLFQNFINGLRMQGNKV